MPFHPLKLLILISWVYLCLFCVQKIQFSALIRARYRTPALLLTFFTGPLFIIVLILGHAIKHSRETGEQLLDVILDQIQEMIAGISRLASAGSKKNDAIMLLDASGRSLDEIYSQSGRGKKNNQTLKTTENLIAQALTDHASDILIDPKAENIYSVRYRIDGLLQVVQELTGETCKAVVNSIKAISSMDISEKRRPQDGAFIARQGKMTASFRVASAGVLNGEKLSIRILNHSASEFTLHDTGLSRKQIDVFTELIAKPSGMILICGPTGSGKTTTLYAMLNEMDRYTRNVITIEDPIEAVLPEASQIEINTKADITFAKTLRSILRQDPDVISIGEIRDEETAEIALRASQTGHLVIATMHCDSNAAAIIRLMDLGISPMLISAGIHAIFSQRLLRTLCKDCKAQATLSASQIKEYQRRNIDPSHIYEPVGCPKCRETGYRGRTAIGDLTMMTKSLKANLSNSEKWIDDLRTNGNQKGQSNLSKQALRKVVSGITSMEEIKRVIG